MPDNPPPSFPTASISVRRSIRWLPDNASEPTDTVVLTAGKTGAFLDVRFFKADQEEAIAGRLDWAFAGFRKKLQDGTVVFDHVVDSRTEDARSVIDTGHNQDLPNGDTLEVGNMVNPATGHMTAYEEIWREIEFESIPPFSVGDVEIKALFAANAQRTRWRARVGPWQLGLGRHSGNIGFYAWQAEWSEQEERWVIRNVVGCEPDKIYLDAVVTRRDVKHITWGGESYEVVEIEV